MYLSAFSTPARILQSPSRSSLDLAVRMMSFVAAAGRMVEGCGLPAREEETKCRDAVLPENSWYGGARRYGCFHSNPHQGHCPVSS